MADLAKYVVALEAETGKYRRELERANKRLERFDKDQRRTLGRIDGGFRSVQSTVQAFGKVFAAVFAGGIVSRGLSEFSKVSDEVALFDARLKSALGGATDLGLREELVGIATETGQSIKGVVDLFQQTSRLRQVLKATDDDFVQFAQNVFRLGIIGGSSTEETANGLRQLRQALASTRVQAEEINSIIEQTPEIAAAIEKALELVPGTLKSAVKEGKVLNDEVFRGILDQTDEIQKKFEEFPRTFNQLRSGIGTEFALAVAAWGEASGLTEKFKETLSDTEGIMRRARVLFEGFAKAAKQLDGTFQSEITIDSGNGQTFIPLPTDDEIKQVEDLFAKIQEFHSRRLAMQAEEERAMQASFQAIQDLQRAADRERLEEERALMDMIADLELDNLKAINREREGFADLFAANLVQASEFGFDAVLRGWALTLQQMLAKALAIKLFEALFPKGIFSSGGAFAGLGQALGFRAEGGPVSSGSPYIVGERGPELFVPGVSGNIVPAGAFGGGNVFHIDARGAVPGVESRIRAAVQEAVAIADRNRIEDGRRR